MFYFWSGVLLRVRGSLIENIYKPSILTEYSCPYKILCTFMAPRTDYSEHLVLGRMCPTSLIP